MCQEGGANCLGCIARDAEIFMLKMEITRLQRIIANGQNAAAGIISYSTRNLNAGGLPRGTWSLLKGRKEAAEEVYQVLR